ncbi:MAG: hypothetical protein U0575_03480 [Phycisphaerales bacterium]
MQPELVGFDGSSPSRPARRVPSRARRAPWSGAALAAALAGPVFGYVKPTVTDGTPPAAPPPNTKYFDIKSDGVDANNPFSKLYVEINPATKDADGDGDIDADDHPMKGKVGWNGAGPNGWSVDVVMYDNKWVLCFSRADNTTNVVTFKICIAPNGTKTAAINGTGMYYWFKKMDGQDAQQATGGGAKKIQLLALSNCCGPNGGLGCDDPVCASAVCSVDSFCCQTQWDSICGDEAATQFCIELCASAGGCPAADHGCFEAGGPGCTDIACCEAVCAQDSFCCQTAWDGICVNEALAACAAPPCCNLACPADLNFDGQVDGGDLGILLADWNQAGTCSNLDGIGAVDGGDLGMVLAAWGSCGGTPEGEPCGGDTNGGCNGAPPVFGSVACGQTIIGNAWAVGGTRDTDWFQFTLGEPTVVKVAMCSQLPMVFGIVDTGGVLDCTLASSVDPFGTTEFCGCADFESCLPAGTWWLFAAPDGFDGFPCGRGDNAYWLTFDCSGPCTPAACGNVDNDCFTASADPFCSGAGCCTQVCAVDPFCCDVAWDGICVDEAKAICGASNCCFANGGVGCDDPACQGVICAIDPFCCKTTWDSICAGEAADLCTICGGSPPAMFIADVSPSFVSQGDTLVITGFGFPSDPLDLCALIVGQPEEPGQTPPTVGLRVLAADPSQLTAVVNGVVPGGVVGQVMIAQGNGQQFMPSNPHPKFKWVSPGGWVWQSNGGPMASSAEFVTASPAAAIACQQFFGAIDPGDGKAAVTITGGATACPIGTTIMFQFDATTLSGAPFSIDKSGTIQAIQNATLGQCADALCAAAQQILNMATGQIWSCTSQVVGATIVLKIGAPGFEEFDPAKPFTFWVKICTP